MDSPTLHPNLPPPSATTAASTPPVHAGPPSSGRPRRTSSTPPSSHRSSSPGLDLVDYSSSPDPLPASLQPHHNTKTLDFKAALLSAPPPPLCSSRRPASSEDKGKGIASSPIRPAHQWLRSVIVVPGESRGCGTFSHRAAKAPAPAKVWSPVQQMSIKEGPSDHGSQGWEEVRRRHRRPAATAQGPPQKRPVHARLGPLPQHRSPVFQRL